MAEPVIDLLAEEWQKLDELCSALTPEEWARPTECPGWSVQDQLAHIIGTESALAGETRPPAAALADHVRNEIGSANEAWVASMRDWSGQAVLERFRAVAATRLAQLRSFTTERFDELGPSPIGKAPYRDFMNVRVMDNWVHEQDIRRAIGRPGHRSGPVVEHSIARFLSAMPFVVGKKAGATDGQSVVFDVTGEGGRRFAVVVDGRAELTEQLPAAPTTVLRLDAETWWCLALGRQDPQAALATGQVAIEGDADLGRAVVTNLNFMI